MAFNTVVIVSILRPIRRPRACRLIFGGPQKMLALFRAKRPRSDRVKYVREFCHIRVDFLRGVGILPYILY